MTSTHGPHSTGTSGKASAGCGRASKIDAPLGSRALRVTRRLPELQRAALDALAEWFAEQPDAYVAFSGGKDSTTCLHLARQVHPRVPVLWFDSGLEFPQTREYVYELADRWSLNLHVIPAEPDALTVLAASGHYQHGTPKAPLDLLHHACITRPLRTAKARFGRHSVYGLRADESAQRRALLSRVNGRVTRHERDGTVGEAYLAPIWRWSWQEVHGYLGQHEVPINPVYDALARLGVPTRRHRVGLLVDGWSLEQGRWGLARQVAPDFARLVESRLPALADWR